MESCFLHRCLVYQHFSARSTPPHLRVPLSGRRDRRFVQRQTGIGNHSRASGALSLATPRWQHGLAIAWPSDHRQRIQGGAMVKRLGDYWHPRKDRRQTFCPRLCERTKPHIGKKFTALVGSLAKAPGTFSACSCTQPSQLTECATTALGGPHRFNLDYLHHDLLPSYVSSKHPAKCCPPRRSTGTPIPSTWKNPSSPRASCSRIHSGAVWEG
jgi:hypothetical protein